MWIWTSILTAAAEPELPVLKPVVGDVMDVSQQNIKAWEDAFQYLQKISENPTTTPDGYTYPKGFDEALSGPWQTISDGCSWYCGGMIEVTSASSSLPTSKSGSYAAVNLHDSDVRTAWVEGKEDYGVGESITLKSSGAYIDRIDIWNGYQKSPELYTKNSRVKVLKLYINDKPSILLHLEDTPAVQYFNLEKLIEQTTTSSTSETPSTEQPKPRTLRFEIMEVYPGSKWKDTAISEINFDGYGVH